MSHELNRKSIGDRIHFNSVSDPKFKNNRLSVNFVLPLSRETASDYAAVPFILRRGCREYPDFTSLNARLDNLYGARLEADIGKHAGYQVLELSIQMPDNRFALEGENITALCADLLAAAALDPKLDENGLFSEEDTALEKQYVIDTIEAEINEKRGYAVSQCIQAMCEGEPLAVRRYGYRDTAERITPESAASAYRRMLETAPIEVFFTGSGDPSVAEKIFAERLAGLRRNSFDYERTRMRAARDPVREKIERMEISQSKMVMGLRAAGLETQEEINAARVFSSLFGGTPFSKLFLNVREKLSLCYYCASRFDVSTGLLLVDSGIEAKNRKQAQDEILRQLEAVRAGDFDDEQLANTKLLMKNTIRNTTDSLSAIEGWYLSQILRSQSVTPYQDTRNLDAVTREQVAEAAKRVALDTVYFLTGTEKEEAQ